MADEWPERVDESALLQLARRRVWGEFENRVELCRNFCAGRRLWLRSGSHWLKFSVATDISTDRVETPGCFLKDRYLK